jgi:hypothetical protein
MSGVIRAVRAGLGYVMLLVAVGGFVVWILADTGVFGSDADAYGHVSIPGKKILHLPGGEVDASFQVGYYSTNNVGVNLPHARLAVHPIGGEPAPVVTRSLGASTHIETNNNSTNRERMWKIQVARAGDYRVIVGGRNDVYDGAGLIVFGHGSQLASLAIRLTLIALAALALLWLVLGFVRRLVAPSPARAAAPAAGYPTGPTWSGAADLTRMPAAGDDQVKLAQLEALGKLHDRGALSDDEFNAQKARILGE